MKELMKKNLTCNGEGQFEIYRIPGMVVTKADTILVYFEMRLGSSDWSAMGIGLCRSEDKGEHWSDVSMIATGEGDIPVNNPVMIAGEDGTVFFLWQLSYSRGFIQASKDDGKTFSPPVEITKDLEKFRTQGGYPWKVIALGPGHGIQLKDSRLLIPVWMANGENERSHMPSVASVIISKDGGLSFETGEIIKGDMENPNETTAAELKDGQIMLNLRHSGKPCMRFTAVSKNGLNGYSLPTCGKQLVDPGCFGSLYVIRDARFLGGEALLFSNCNNSTSREDLTIRLSEDDGASWKYSRLLEQHGGYSDLASSMDGSWIYCFYESGEFLTFARVSTEWLMEGKVHE